MARIPFTLPSPFTRQQIKEIVAHPANQRAERAMAVIKDPQGTVAAMAAIFAEGDCYDRVVARSSVNPRKAIAYHFMLDAAYPYGNLAVDYPNPDATVIGGTIPMPADWQRRLELFTWMAENDFTPGRNDWRGDLFPAILVESTYRHGDPCAFAFAKAVVDTGRLDLPAWAAREYAWVGSVAKLAVVRRLGLDLRSPGLLDRSASLLGCSPNSGEKETDRAEVIRELVAAGAKLSRDSLRKLTSTAHRSPIQEYARKHGIYDLILGALVDEPVSA